MGNSLSQSCIGGDDHVTNKETERGWSDPMDIEFAVSGMKGMRQTMEDQHIHTMRIPVCDGDDLENHAIFAVFDGHGGGFTAKFLADNFLNVLSKREELVKYSLLANSGPKGRSDVNAVVLLQKAIVRTFVQLDEQLLPLHKERTDAILNGRMQPPPIADIEYGDRELQAKLTKQALGERSGSTAVVVVVTPSHFICANCGDSRAVLRRNGNVLPLSFDHKPSDLPERIRINHAGGFVRGRRVDGDLAVSRAFGDFMYKDDPHLEANQQKITVFPDVVIYPRIDDQDEFIVLACDGIWDVASNKQCADYVQRLLSEGESDLGNICEEMLDTCLDRQSRDNMTIMLVGLSAMKIDGSSAAAMNNALWGHRATRRANRVTNGTVNAFSHFGTGILQNLTGSLF